MKRKLPHVVCLMMFSLLVGVPSVHAQTHWFDVSDAKLVRQIVSGNAFNQGQKQWFYRQDGNVAIIHFPDRSISVRKWKIDDDAKLCEAIFTMPAKIIACGRIQTTADERPKYRLRLPAATYNFEALKTPPEELAAAIDDKAGPLRSSE